MVKLYYTLLNPRTQNNYFRNGMGWVEKTIFYFLGKRVHVRTIITLALTKQISLFDTALVMTNT